MRSPAPLWCVGLPLLLVPPAAAAQPEILASAGDAYVTYDAGTRVWTIGTSGMRYALGLNGQQSLTTVAAGRPGSASILRSTVPDATVTFDGLRLDLGSTQSRFRYRTFSVAAEEAAVQLSLAFEHLDTGALATRYYRAAAGAPVVEVWTRITIPSGRRDVTASDLTFWRLSIPNGTVRTVGGLWPTNGLDPFTVTDRTISAGRQFSFGSLDRSSSTTVPVFSVQIPSGTFFGGVIWSGRWAVSGDRQGDRLDLALTVPQMQTRISSTRPLDIPGAFFGLAPGPAEAARPLATFVVRGLRNGRAFEAPVTYNTWFVTGSFIDEENVRDQMEYAARLGAEAFVLDAGWYPGRRDAAFQFTAGLGLWDVDAARFPNGLAALADAAHERGMRFGVWVEPERVDLATVGRPGLAQERWLATRGGKYGTEDSADEVPSAQVCLAHPAARQWVLDRVSEFIEQSGADYLKWDNNFWIDCDRDGHGHGQQDGGFAHVQGLYQVLAELRERFPDVIFENCSGGGNRLDFGMLRLTDVGWIDDQSTPAGRVRHNLQGLLQFFPAPYLFSFVMGGSSETIHENQDFPLLFRSRMSGMLGLAFHGAELEENEFDQATQEIALYKDLRSILQASIGIPLTPQHDGDSAPPWEVVEHVAEGQGDVVIFAFQNDDGVHETLIKPVMLAPDVMYELSVPAVDTAGGPGIGGISGVAPAIYSGEELMRDGFLVFESARSAAHVILLRPVAIDSQRPAHPTGRD